MEFLLQQSVEWIEWRDYSNLSSAHCDERRAHYEERRADSVLEGHHFTFSTENGAT